MKRYNLNFWLFYFFLVRAKEAVSSFIITPFFIALLQWSISSNGSSKKCLLFNPIQLKAIATPFLWCCRQRSFNEFSRMVWTSMLPRSDNWYIYFFCFSFHLSDVESLLIRASYYLHLLFYTCWGFNFAPISLFYTFEYAVLLQRCILQCCTPNHQQALVFFPSFFFHLFNPPWGFDYCRNLVRFHFHAFFGFIFFCSSGYIVYGFNLCWFMLLFDLLLILAN